MDEFTDIVLRLGAAVLAGAAIGVNRDLANKPIGMRTLALVALGAAVISLAGIRVEGMAEHPDALSRVVQGIILIPFVIPIALSSLAWKWMFDSLYSVINWLLLSVHLIDYPWQWLGTPGLAMWPVIIFNVWRGFPFSAVVLLAGLTAVPVEVIEAA